MIRITMSPICLSTARSQCQRTAVVVVQNLSVIYLRMRSQCQVVHKSFLYQSAREHMSFTTLKGTGVTKSRDERSILLRWCDAEACGRPEGSVRAARLARRSAAGQGCGTVISSTVTSASIHRICSFGLPNRL